MVCLLGVYSGGWDVAAPVALNGGRYAFVCFFCAPTVVNFVPNADSCLSIAGKTGVCVDLGQASGLGRELVVACSHSDGDDRNGSADNLDQEAVCE